MNQQLENDLCKILEFVVESGRVVGNSQRERIASAVEEVSFESSERNIKCTRREISAVVGRHYKG